MLAREHQNLGDKACRRSTQVGVLAAGLSILVVLLFADAPIAQRYGWLMAIPVAISSYFLLTGSSGVCAYHSMLGRRAADHGPEAILDGEKVRRMRLRSLFAIGVSACLGCVVAALFVAGF
jgi:hypothetical protein